MIQRHNEKMVESYYFCHCCLLRINLYCMYCGDGSILMFCFGNRAVDFVYSKYQSSIKLLKLVSRRKLKV